MHFNSIYHPFKSHFSNISIYFLSISFMGIHHNDYLFHYKKFILNLCPEYSTRENHISSLKGISFKRTSAIVCCTFRCIHLVHVCNIFDDIEDYFAVIHWISQYVRCSRQWQMLLYITDIYRFVLLLWCIPFLLKTTASENSCAFMYPSCRLYNYFV